MAAADATAGATGTAAKVDHLLARAPLLVDDEVPSSLAARATRKVALDGGSGAVADALTLPSPLQLLLSRLVDEEESSSSLSSRFKCCSVAYRRRKISSLAKPLDKNEKKQSLMKKRTGTESTTRNESAHSF